MLIFQRKIGNQSVEILSWFLVLQYFQSQLIIFAVNGFINFVFELQSSEVVGVEKTVGLEGILNIDSCPINIEFTILN